MNVPIIHARELTAKECELFFVAKNAMESAERVFLQLSSHFHSYWLSLAPKIPDGEELESTELVRSPNNVPVILVKIRAKP
jgi:hypothetical protein